mmetsp:Transcript_40409/g.49003  ORF Transcript_40409/g.49003 Transcript_40409/m.49003 type:complete len:241 (-) Transcript_40409:147-869(-)
MGTPETLMFLGLSLSCIQSMFAMTPAPPALFPFKITSVASAQMPDVMSSSTAASRMECPMRGNPQSLSSMVPIQLSPLQYGIYTYAKSINGDSGSFISATLLGTLFVRTKEPDLVSDRLLHSFWLLQNPPPLRNISHLSVAPLRPARQKNPAGFPSRHLGPEEGRATRVMPSFASPRAACGKVPARIVTSWRVKRPLEIFVIVNRNAQENKLLVLKIENKILVLSIFNGDCHATTCSRLV